MTWIDIAHIDPQNLFTTLAEPWVSFEIDPIAHPGYTVRPGQPVSVTWQITDHHGNPIAGSFDGTVLLNGAPIMDLGSVRAVQIPPERFPHAFYTLGQTATLHLRVIGTGTSAGQQYDLDSEQLTIVGDPITWTWDPAPGTQRWKQDSYTISGSLANAGQWTTLTGSVVIHENDDQPAASTPRDLGPFSVTIPRAGMAPVSTPNINHQWEWFDHLLLTLDGPQNISFSYSIAYSLRDDYGNAYNGPIVSPGAGPHNQGVMVAVSEAKQLEFAAASSAQILAVGLAAAAVAALVGIFSAALAVPLGAASAIAEVSAKAATVAADDPPAPDPQFGEAVQVTPLALPAGLLGADAQSNFSGLASAFTAVSFILAAQTAQSEVEGRLLGALMAKDAAGIALQQASYLDIVAKTVDAAQSLLTSEPIAVKELDAAGLLDPDLQQKAIDSWLKNSPTPDMLKQLEAAGLAASDVSILEKLAQNPTLTGSASPLDQQLRTLAVALASLAAENRRYVSTVVTQLFTSAKPMTLMTPAMMTPEIPTKSLQKQPTSKNAASGEGDTKIKEELEATLIMPLQPAALKAQVQLPSGKTIPITTEQVMVGRGVSDTPEAAALDLSSELEKATVSRIHAQITRVDDHFELEDHHSSNLTRLNQEILAPRRRYHLHDGDVMEFGKVRCVFHLA